MSHRVLLFGACEGAMLSHAKPCSPLSADSFHARGWEVDCRVLVPSLGAVLSQHCSPHKAGPQLTAVPYVRAEQGIETLCSVKRAVFFCGIQKPATDLQ